ncbi:hypothetical protein BN1723_003200 [Verticillium longisporum]|uniref:Uncharacterized protein n=1 Tax=Verticillium longisporum TaxID=100787 RepID=A0A0G4LI96_VERLO|nr:hypothetical protein BN1708_013198 [Verticillium longisporum]CRK24674.1 hypothetical protein BN1723_003200 [Verticillium longisporum]
MVDRASHSWEWGTTAEALLELYNPELSVFGPEPFPGGKIPKADPSTFALRYARRYINRNSQILVSDSTVGDPASLGVSAILLGQSENVYLGASKRQAEYLLNSAPRWSNGAISHRSEEAELWIDNMAMSFPFLAYQAVQDDDASLMAETVRQCGLYRDVLQPSGTLDWRHIVGPISPDYGLWSTGNGWAGYGMVRVLLTLQKWPRSASMSWQAQQLKTWIKEILDGAMLSGFDGGLLRNYLNDDSWFGEISGTAMLSAVAYRMAINDPAMFPQRYITWADTNRKALSVRQGRDGVFVPAVNPYAWLDRKQYYDGSSEGQAFAVHLNTAYRDCVNAKVCSEPPSSAATVSKPGLGPRNIVTILTSPVTFTAIPDPTGTVCAAPQSCDDNDCNGAFNGLSKSPTCQSGPRKGCQCQKTAKTCGSRQSCEINGCAGAFNGLSKYPTCTGNFEGCECNVTPEICGPHQPCDRNSCAGAFDGLAKYPKCSGNFEGCECTVTPEICGPRQPCNRNGCEGAFNWYQPYAQCSNNFEGCECSPTPETCGPPQSCDLNGCAGTFDLSDGRAYCRQNFRGCECAATPTTCGTRQSCDNNNCAGAFAGNMPFPKCTNFFRGCDCEPTPGTCGPPQSCGMNGCGGGFDLSNGKAWCTQNFEGCECQANAATCGAPQPCDRNNCDGTFWGNVPSPQCNNFFNSCVCQATSNTCGPKQSCDNNGCAGGYDSNGVARCQGNFRGCECNPSSRTCGTAQACDLNGCNGAFDNQSNVARCRGSFAGCVCNPVPSTGGTRQSCLANGCNGIYNNGNPICAGNYFGCACEGDPRWIPEPPKPPRPVAPRKAGFMITMVSVMINKKVIDSYQVFNLKNVLLPGGICDKRFISGREDTSPRPYPDSLPAFDIDSFSNCRYSGTARDVGSLTCNDNPLVECTGARGGASCNDANGLMSALVQFRVECWITSRTQN